MGQTHKIRPDRSSFIIQRKATYIFPTITEHMENNDLKGAKARIDQIFSLLTTLAKRELLTATTHLFATTIWVLQKIAPYT